MNANLDSSSKPLDYVNVAFLSITPLIAIIGTTWYSYYYGITWLEIVNFLIMYLLTGLSITGGYHRYYSHKSYECSKPLQLLYLVFGAAAVENSVLNWCSDHRNHHQFVDQEEDPYSILKGGLYAHIGWILHKETRQIHERYKNVPDLLKNPLVVWQNRWYLPLVVIFGFLLPTFIGWTQGRALGGLLWGGFLRVVVVQHMTFFINSLAHMYGSRPFTEENSARDNWWLGPLTFGEGYHNFHHKFQGDFRNGYRWYQFDITKWWLYVMKSLGLAWKLRRTPDIAIFRAQLETQVKRLQKHLEEAKLPQVTWEMLRKNLETGHERLDKAFAQYHYTKSEYQRQRRLWSKQVRQQYQQKIHNCQKEWLDARKRWSELVKSLCEQISTVTYTELDA